MKIVKPNLAWFTPPGERPGQPCGTSSAQGFSGEAGKVSLTQGHIMCYCPNHR